MTEVIARDAAVGSETARASQSGWHWRPQARGALRESALVLVLALIWTFFYVRTEGTFLTQRNLILLALQTSIVSLAAISAVMLIVTRNFDLSVGSAVALVGVIVATLTVWYGVQPLIACGVALLAGLIMGAWQGVWVTRLGVTSFIVTLAGMLYFRGGSMILTSGATVAPVPAALTDFATGFLSPTYAVPLIVFCAMVYVGFQMLSARRAHALGVLDEPRLAVMRSSLPVVLVSGAAVWLVMWAGLPYLVLLVATCAVGAEILMRGTRFGASLYAIGGNPEAARMAGIDVRRMVFANFVTAGLLYGVTGIALTARVSGAVAGSAGVFLELDAIAAAIIGGTSLQGGHGRVVGALLGALLMGSLNNGMSLMNVPTFYQDTARGVVLLLAVALDQLNRRRSA